MNLNTSSKMILYSTRTAEYLMKINDGELYLMIKRKKRILASLALQLEEVKHIISILRGSRSADIFTDHHILTISQRKYFIEFHFITQHIFKTLLFHPIAVEKICDYLPYFYSKIKNNVRVHNVVMLMELN